MLDWNSASVPQLNDYRVIAQGPLVITNVDAVNGIVDFSMNGELRVGGNAVPVLTTLGSIGLAIGLLGFAALALGRNGRRDGATGV
jgi:hypothetical protein